MVFAKEKKMLPKFFVQSGLFSQTFCKNQNIRFLQVLLTVFESGIFPENQHF